MKYFSLATTLSITTLFRSSVQDCTQCSSNQPTISAPHKNVWRPLSAEEQIAVSNVVTQKLGVDPNPAPNSTATNALGVGGITLLQPNKSIALSFIDGNDEEPSRFARATVLFTSQEGPFRQEYLVGPLPATNATPIVPLTYPFNNEQPGKSRSPYLYAVNTTSDWIASLSNEIANITNQIWNSTILEGGIGPRLGNVIWEDDGTQSLWIALYGPSPTGFDSTTLLPLGVYFKVAIRSLRWQEWKIDGWYYRGVYYKSTEDFQDAIYASTFDKPVPNVDGTWTSTDKQGELHLDDLPPPITVAEGGNRFSLDKKENFVSWMDFGFYLVTSPELGLALFDIRFKNQRIIYELALQEALAHYAGSDPVLSETLYFDSFGGMGNSMVSLVKGHDCPSHATYLDAAVPDAICMFEADTNYPIRRHFAFAQNYTSVARNVAFTVRWIATVGNYDYLFDYTFFYDGAIEVSVRASGYISAAYFAENDDYGFKIHDSLSGALHDHVMTFKVDLDVLGRQNSVQKVKVVPATVEYPWSAGKARKTMKLEKSFITHEDKSGIPWAPNDAAIYAIVNKDSPNKYGEYPGYRVKRAAGATHLTMSNSSDAGRAAHFATADLFVTRQKDTEPRAADWVNTYDVDNPLVDFAKFLDGESLEQEDIVLWFNLGMHHVPNTGDLPNTVMTSAHSAMRLEPLNYLLNDPSIQTSQQVRVNHTSGEVETFDAQTANCSVNFSTLNQLFV
ncbi:membrane copper amine oxidase [Paraphaeosphaeria sporulosa]|uniref:Amine oxidase n=1 Tax=Paraphaeosphaeria sporulosa TaxID=1460663 RepID=A0A177CC94_9PLEO|nr:membrane copper amine oxidase [Paraphaeosphaeria sporulosa]OAG04417.1 membrane copper amine oxidase [Paraphaeosphaeria sporulosa]